MKKFYDTEYGGAGGFSYETLPENIKINPSIGDLYQNVLNRYVKGPICLRISMYTPQNKVESLEKHFNMQKPSIFSKFFWHKSYRKFGNISFVWWNSFLGGNEQRKLFLAHLAKKYKNKHFK